MQPSVYQSNRQQLLLMSASIFASVTAAVIVSTLLVMSLMRGEIASALNSTVKNAAPTTTQVASSCVVPESEQSQPSAAYDENSSVTPVAHTASAPLHYKHHYAKAAAPVHSSYNNTSTVNSTTTNNITNTELHKTTIIKDSFNKGSYNDKSQGSHNTIILKDNTVNVDSNNTTTTNTNSNNTKTIDNSIVVKDNTVNVNSNNVKDSNNTYTKNSNNTVEVLSNNTVTLPEALPPVIPIITETTPAV